MYPYQQPNYPPSANAEYYAQKMRDIAGYGNYNPGFNQNYQQPNIICRIVTSIDEARAAMIDGLNTYIFADFANGKMYVKRIENNGAASLRTFALEAVPEKTLNYTEQISALERRIADLEGKREATTE